MKKTIIIALAAGVLSLSSCRYISVEPSYEGDGTTFPCELDTSIPSAYDQSMAKDSDTPGSDAAIYWEANDFSNKVNVMFQQNTAEVNTAYTGVEVTVEGACVTLDFASKGGANAEVILSGASNAGSIRIISNAKLKLTLDGVQLISANGPAILCQGAETVFIDSPSGKANTLGDSTQEVIEEGMEGCLYAGGSIVFSGKGLLRVSGNYKNGISTESFVWIRPGATVVVENAKTAGININGSDKQDSQGDELGLMIAGGYLYVRTDAEGAAAINCKSNVKILDGEVYLYTTGDSKFVEEGLDVQQSTALVARGDVTVYGGKLTAKSSGLGGQSIYTDGSYVQYAGDVLATTTGKYYKYHNLIGQPRAVVTELDLSLDGGSLSAASTYPYLYSYAFKTGKKFSVNDGDLYAYSFDDAMKVQDLEINGGYVFAFSAGANATNSDNEIVFNGGLTEMGAMDAAFKNGGGFYIYGGTVLGVYGDIVLPSDYEQSYMYYHTGISGNTGDVVAVLEGNRTVFSFIIPRSQYVGRVMYSSPDETFENDCEIYKWGEVQGVTKHHRILIEDGNFVGGYFVDVPIQITTSEE